MHPAPAGRNHRFGARLAAVRARREARDRLRHFLPEGGRSMRVRDWRACTHEAMQARTTERGTDAATRDIR